jgi:hypothetical protein
MCSICVIHNHERDRLSYLMPKVRALAQAIPSATIHELGPATDCGVTRLRSDSRLNRLRRAFHWGIMVDHDRMLEPRGGDRASRQRLLQFRNNARNLYYGHDRSVSIEHDILLAHAGAWRIAAQNGSTPTFVFESDVRFSPHAVGQLAALATAYRGVHDASYVVIAGGCEHKDMLCSWCFEREHGCEETLVAGMAMFRLPRFVNNTVAGYMLTSATAQLFCRLMRRAPMLAPDWAMMAWSLSGKLNNVTCLHCVEPVLQQGSLTGVYRSTTGTAYRPTTGVPAW